MYFQNILGNNNIKTILVEEIGQNKIPHAQLFSGAKGAGQLPMALAFVMYLFCQNRKPHDSCGKCASCIKMLKLMHPDLHFFYPTKGSTSSKDCFVDFQKMVIQNPYLDKDDWQQHHNINSRSEIKVRDANIIHTIINLKSYEGAYKVFVIWLPEAMNPFTSNKLLKHIEEPSENTLFILVSENIDFLLPTIKSRLQIKTFEKIENSILLKHLQNLYPELEEPFVEKIINKNQNNYNLILKKINGKINEEDIHNSFINWIRLCFLAYNKKSVPDLIKWCENISQSEKSLQLEFLQVSTEIFRHAFLLNYTPPFGLYPEIQHSNFNIRNFANYLTKNNIHKICSLLDSSHDYLNRYANSKILFLDLSFSLGKLLHK